ncbi:molybdenum ABC transporter ATP-binding protein [Acidocella sp.]|uniref:molybdenum ABC transporter ATP-binding protein n=1 Tax=Acidocella sp. TaxID=50710 RepID=UPI003D08D4AD
MSEIVARFSGGVGAFQLDVGFTIPGRGITGLFGRSGCGKSTLLRCLAGLMRMPGGELRVGDQLWQDARTFLPPWQRAVGYVFQESRLFAHLSVKDNLLFGQRRARAGRIMETDVTGFLGLETLLARSPVALSGGERQRVAIGRALLTQPRLLLMDEPLAALDRESADEILPCLHGISENFGVPVVYVSHHMPEIERIAGHLLVMSGGRVAANGALAEILTDLSLPFAARTGAATVLDLTVGSYDEVYGLTLCGTSPLQLVVPGCLGPAGTPVRLRVRADDVSVTTHPGSSSILNSLPARILEVTALEGPHVVLALEVGGTRLLARITRKSWEGLGLAEGKDVFVQIKAEALAGTQGATSDDGISSF